MQVEALVGLESGLRGRAIAPGDSGYENARKIWNGMIDKRPRLIIRCRGADDVKAAVDYARRQGLPTSVRGGGHHVAGGALSERGIVIDLSEMRGVSFDPSTNSVVAEGGARLRDVDHATLPHGRAVPMGVFSDTGIAGLTLAGGYGWQSRARGLSCDNLISAQIVTADGKLVGASAEENPDLFWALRGGGTNLGVVTSFRYRTHPMPPELFLLFATYPLAHGRQVLQGLREYARTAPLEAGLIAVIWTFPVSEALPKETWNQPFVGIIGPYIGPTDEGRRQLAPLRELGPKLFDGSKATHFGAVQAFFDDDYPEGRRYYWRSTYLEQLSDAAIAELVQLGSRRPSALNSLDLWVLGGALGQVGAADSPIAHRSAPYMVGIESNWIDPAQDAANIAWAREAQTLLSPYSTGGSYLNFEDPADQQRVAAVYGANHPRLKQLKAKYDPHGLFGARHH